jgi:hypothetical protein
MNDNAAPAADPHPFDGICQHIRGDEFFPRVLREEYPLLSHGHSRMDHREPACEAV